MEEKKAAQADKNHLSHLTCYPVDVDENIKMGYIEKRSRYIRKWRHRYMVLDMNKCTISWYKEKDFKEMTATIVLGEKTEIIPVHNRHITKEKIETNENKEEKINNETIDPDTYGFELHFNNKKTPDITFKVNKNGEIYIDPNKAAQNTLTISYPELGNITLPIRCKFEKSRDEWIDLIKDCIIRAKYHKYFLMDITYIDDENIEVKQEDIDSIPVIKRAQDPIKMVAMLRELLSLRHNNGKWKYWQILGHLYGKHFANIRQCVLCFEKAMEWKNNDIHILKDFVMILQRDNIKELNSLYVLTKKRKLYEQMIQIDGYKVLNDNNWIFCDDLCNTLLELKDYDKLSSILAKIVEFNLNLRKDIQCNFWLKLSNKIQINAKAMENVILNLKPNKLNEELELKMWKHLISMNPIKQFEYLKKMESIYIERENNNFNKYNDWSIYDLNQFAWILLELGETMKAKTYLEISILKNKSNVETLKLIHQSVMQQEQQSVAYHAEGVEGVISDI